MEEDYVFIRLTLEKRNLEISLRHFNEIPILINQRNWEAANGQIRSFLESIFMDLCLILLGKRKAGGEARKALQNAGVLSEEQANYIFSFMKLSHGQGAHPGISNELEAKSRWFATISIAIIACSLFPKVVLISEVFKLANITTPTKTLITEDHFKTTCHVCETSQLLTEAEVKEINKETHYRCKNGCQTLLIIGIPGTVPIPGRGYRLNDYVVRNSNDVIFKTPDTRLPILLPKSPASLRGNVE